MLNVDLHKTKEGIEALDTLGWQLDRYKEESEEGEFYVRIHQMKKLGRVLVLHDDKNDQRRGRELLAEVKELEQYYPRFAEKRMKFFLQPVEYDKVEQFLPPEQVRKRRRGKFVLNRRG